MHYPASDFYGWVAGQGWTRKVSSYLGAEWAVAKLYMRVPAGADLCCSPGRVGQDGHAKRDFTGESGAWFGQAAIPLYNPS